jgi:3-methyladenine DNA glycosylase/8-oxoguanine DNA glycosylase
MPRSLTLTSAPPHDFFLALDIDAYFDHEHDIERIADEGWARPLALADRDVMATIFFNGDPDNPVFTVQFSDDLTEKELFEAASQLKRMLGTELNLAGLRTQAADDAILAPLLDQYYGFKRIARATFFEEAMGRLIQTQISHKPTARKMVYRVREAYAGRVETRKGSIPSWPRPVQLIGADPVAMKAYGLSERKGEYVIGLAHAIVSGAFPFVEIDTMAPDLFMETVSKIRGIGPTTAQDLMLYRLRTDAVFPSRIEKGQEIGFRRWICYSYGTTADNMSEETFQHLIRYWKGYEAMALEYFYLDWMIREKKRK